MKYAGEPHQEDLATGERSTRNRVARSILDHGPSTVSDLAGRLGLTQAAVRRHLDALVADTVVEPRDQRVYGSRGRGRPAKVFALTDCGRDAFDQSYDQLAADALDWIARAAGGGPEGDAAVTAFARDRIATQAEPYREAVAAAPPERRTEALARALSADGYAATARGAPSRQGEQLCQHHCPVAHVAEKYPQLCEAETEFFSELLGTHVQRLATIAHGDGVCTTFIPHGAGHGAPPGATARDGTPGTGGPRISQQTDHHASESTAGRNPA
ncbi:transcriptional regulator [Streptomyces sp. NBC_01498]|uniref:helix-turn-helix transcriptional regulator n=1 Tax=Streptomyces sp. NBC_01498 TaxID=2975870 RepID=UPI002E7B5797|nr:metalloregulator ArsR/SmtB family transcription factor [Streptomyces sp. NBC_01498]WTL27461.1 transcriptional regulator [Streptomyces sp. NBC_01498]